ncbi:hypothetical protein SAMN02910344_01924 [Ruminobacter amylophilus]|uniref:Uncharacterized protein n=1 Tax=Ruminobacter amylophilus TaxID=867 RepID=A0A662ZJ73_9GAMM|nr:hypothetical protein [Ruminobacter amylophilus]SFP63415.1 hypothetical protein SAMN02910344_01924 [Ruminobacter amylophilus]
MIYIPESEKIYFEKTQRYFSEVISSYSDGRYRSAVVILYSVVICDLLLKLKELSDVYDDKQANLILSEIDDNRQSKDNSISKSKWEKDLVEKIYKQTNLLDDATYTNICHLKDHRNFCAHPSLNENYELFEPSKEMAICHIKNMLEGVLIKPPIFISNVLEMMLKDLEDKKEIYINDKDKFRSYVSRKYFRYMTNDMKKKMFRSFWKLCFCLPNDEKCTSNIRLNLWVLEFLYIEIHDICDYIKSERMFTQISPDDVSCTRLCAFLALNPKAYSNLGNEIKDIIKSFVEKNALGKQISWFVDCNYKKHIQKLMSENFYSNIDNIVFNFMKKTYGEIGELSIFVDYCIEYFNRSENYSQAGQRYKFVISTLLANMTKEQYLKLISVINSNNQLYGRYDAYYANTEIVSYAISKLGNNFDFNQYENFKFDSTKISTNSENNNETSGVLNNILSS